MEGTLQSHGKKEVVTNQKKVLLCLVYQKELFISNTELSTLQLVMDWVCLVFQMIFLLKRIAIRIRIAIVNLGTPMNCQLVMSINQK